MLIISSKNFDTFPYSILTDKSTEYGLDKWTVMQTENYLNSHANRFMITSTKTRWKQISSVVCEGSIPDPTLFNFFGDLDNGPKGTLSNFANDTKLGGMADTSDGCTAPPLGSEKPHEVQQGEMESLALHQCTRKH